MDYGFFNQSFWINLVKSDGEHIGLYNLICKALVLL